MTDRDLDHALIDVEQAVAYMRRAIRNQLETVVASAEGKRQSLPSELLVIISDFWHFDPAHLKYEFGGYVYSLLTDNPARFSDKFMGYEWNGDEDSPVIDILIRKAKAS